MRGRAAGSIQAWIRMMPSNLSAREVLDPLRETITVAVGITDRVARLILSKAVFGSIAQCDTVRLRETVLEGEGSCIGPACPERSRRVLTNREDSHQPWRTTLPQDALNRHTFYLKVGLPAQVQLWCLLSILLIITSCLTHPMNIDLRTEVLDFEN